jgi:hypothetical protein
MQTTKPGAVNDAAVAKVLSNVRRAVNYNKLRKLKRGFVFEEIDAKANKNQSDVKILTFDSSGEFREDSLSRSERPFGFEITVKKNHKAEFIGFYNVAGYEDGLMTTYKFNSRKKCLSHCRERTRLWLEGAAKWSASLN